ncbi:MAG: RES family NAD+ phosphorylase [Kineosporiaceae bacterium]|nr:RES family NAD+ phosphorylase [Aeromicrobium sp.]
MKVPATPPSEFTTNPSHLRSFNGRLWRVYRTVGAHAVNWDELRHFGPVAGMRFDPHPLPQSVNPEIGVMYTATDMVTALGEVYQNGREITRAVGGATLVAWDPSRVLTLLDLTTTWPVLNGAAASIMMDDKEHTQAWAHAIHDRARLILDGLYHRSSITNRPMVTLFSRTERHPAFPPRPQFRALLTDSAADPLVSFAAKELSFKVS